LSEHDPMLRNGRRQRRVHVEQYGRQLEPDSFRSTGKLS
jgi:hypothetical protein